MASAITAPSTLKQARHWVVHKNKTPYGSNGTPKGWNLAEYWFTFDEAQKRLTSGGYDGLGFIVARESGKKDKQIIGGDLDNCRDPITGEGSKWALDILNKLNTSSAPSFSGCGYRFFCFGKLPDGINEVTGHGSDDLTNEMKEHIMAAKPSVKEKLEKYGDSNVWNGFEIYEDGPKHLTVTGQWLPEYPAELQHRNSEVLEVIKQFIPSDNEKVQSKNTGTKSTRITGNHLPSLSILDVINTAGFTHEGDELVGANPALGSTTGKNIKVNPKKNMWCNFHDDIKKGGDPWLYLACECGAIDWEDAGQGALTSGVVVRKTLEHAVKRGLVSEDVLKAKSIPYTTKQGLTLEQLTKAIKKVVQIDPDTGDVVLDESNRPVLVTKRALSPSKAALAILGNTSLRINEMDKNDVPKIWKYNGTIWKADGEREIRSIVYPILGDLAYDKGFKEMLHNIRATAPHGLFDQDPYLFPAQDGVIDLRTGEVRPHSPDNGFTFTYNGYCNHSNPDYHLFLWYIASMFPDIRDCLTAIDIISAVGIRIPFEVFIFLLGGGENGKGILEKLILALYTMKRCAATKLQGINKSQFASGGSVL